MGAYAPTVAAGPQPFLGARAARLARRIGLTELPPHAPGVRPARVGLLDGPVTASHEALPVGCLDRISLRHAASPGGAAERHATAMASVVAATGHPLIPIAPGTCIISAAMLDDAMLARPTAATEIGAGLADAVRRLLDRGVDVLLFGVELDPTTLVPPALAASIRDASMEGVLSVVPAGNRGGWAASSLVACRGTVPVIAGGDDALPLPEASAWPSVGVRGLVAPGRDVPAADAPAGYTLRSGSSIAAAIVAAAFARLRRLHPRVPAFGIWHALLEPTGARSGSDIPRLDLGAAHRRLTAR